MFTGDEVVLKILSGCTCIIKSGEGNDHRNSNLLNLEK